MFYSECGINAAIALPKGCFAHSYHQPANAGRFAAFIPTIKYEQNTSLSSRSTIRYYIILALSNNRRTLSSQAREDCARESFASPFTFRDQKDCGQPRGQIHLYVKQFLSVQAFAQTIKIKSDRSPKRVILRLGESSATLGISLTLCEIYI